jgi:hypothetical protein
MEENSLLRIARLNRSFRALRERQSRTALRSPALVLALMATKNAALCPHLSLTHS